MQGSTPSLSKEGYAMAPTQAAPGFPHRNGFARHADLDEASLRSLLNQCLQENKALTGTAKLGWSRQWEYPYVLANLPKDGVGLNILDAGSGFRFFTLLLAKRGFAVHACDLDASVRAKIHKAASRRGLSIEFAKQDLSCMGYPNDLFDFVVCVSVLEHTPDPEAVVKDTWRVLKPGGHLLVTLDVSVDGDRNIRVSSLRALLEVMERYFVCVHPFHDKWLLDETILAASKDVLKTECFRHTAPEQLPWRTVSKTSLRNLLRGKFGRPFFNLAVIGLALRKRTQSQFAETE
jgi:ubiquinone/menaquinone biosynthesis C-methylase UbiE